MFLEIAEFYSLVDFLAKVLQIGFTNFSIRERKYFVKISTWNSITIISQNCKSLKLQHWVISRNFSKYRYSKQFFSQQDFNFHQSGSYIGSNFSHWNHEPLDLMHNSSCHCNSGTHHHIWNSSGFIFTNLRWIGDFTQFMDLWNYFRHL